MTLTNRIAAVHVVYRATGECIHWFGQLTSHSPGILAGMVQSAEQTVGEDEGMVRVMWTWGTDSVYCEISSCFFPALLPDAASVCSGESSEWTEASNRGQQAVKLQR